MGRGRGRSRRNPSAPPADQQVVQQSGQGAVFRQTSVSASFEGPLPPPATLQQYDQIVPGAADRIIAMAEAQNQHRMTMEATVIRSDLWRSNLGLAAGFIVSLAFLVAAVYLIANDQAGPGVILGSVDLVALVGVFVYGSEARRRERRELRDGAQTPGVRRQ